MARAEVVQLLALDSVPVQLGGWSGVFWGIVGIYQSQLKTLMPKKQQKPSHWTEWAIKSPWEKQLMANGHGLWKVISADQK